MLRSYFEDAAWVKSTWFGILLTIAILALTVSIFSIVPKILGTKFEKACNQKYRRGNNSESEG